MGLQETFKKAGQTVVTAFGDVGISTNYLATASSMYNASTGTQIRAITTTAGVTVIFETFSLNQVDGVNIQAKDKRILVPSKNISGIVPTVNDQVVDGTDTWNILNIETDPAEAVWTLQGRKT